MVVGPDKHHLFNISWLMKQWKWQWNLAEKPANFAGCQFLYTTLHCSWKLQYLKLTPPLTQMTRGDLLWLNTVLRVKNFFVFPCHQSSKQTSQESGVYFTGSKGQIGDLWLVNFNPVCLFVSLFEVMFVVVIIMIDGSQNIRQSSFELHWSHEIFHKWGWVFHQGFQTQEN